MNDKRNTLVARYPQDIEVMEEQMMTYKVSTKGMYCPVKVIIQYNDKKVKGVPKCDLKVYCSLTYREPNEHECFRSFINPDRFAISDGLHKKFQQEYLYISLYSMFGKSITITVIFPDPPKPRQIRELEKQERMTLLAHAEFLASQAQANPDSAQPSQAPTKAQTAPPHPHHHTAGPPQQQQHDHQLTGDHSHIPSVPVVEEQDGPKTLAQLDPYYKLMIDQDMMRRKEYSFIKRNIRESPNHFKNIDIKAKKLETVERIEFAKERRSD